MGPVVRWPRKSDNPNLRKDHTKWCEFDMDIGNTTEDYFTLRKEVAYLLKVGYLKDLIKARGRNEDPGKVNPEQKQKCNIPPPPPIYKVKFINGGSEICGLTSSAAKTIAKTPQTKSPCKPSNIPPITFGDCDLVGILDLHHDGLVISMQVGTANVRRILVDRGSSVNLIMLDILKAMKISEDQITKKSSVLVGFSGETKNSLGEIYLPTYAESVASYERFGVLDCLSSYSVILGRPWIHNVKAVPYTYHQCIKILTDWGVGTIKGEHKSAQECYTEALKPSKAAPHRMETDQIILNPEYLESGNGKVPFPLPHIDAMVDATTGHKMLTFMDASSGFNQIKMVDYNLVVCMFVRDNVECVVYVLHRMFHDP
ncbi:uncharacterized protein LOC141619888 [Silene latifolia]|uniref:uncharacterized protein LOC141619888 n=1 Tax=Silene latifolia TaxID=37657 RepID=UPI003D773772